MILDGDCHVVAKQIESAQFLVVEQGIAVAAAQCDQSDKFAVHFQRRDALEQFRRNIPVRTQEDFIGAGVHDNRAARRSERVNMFRQQRHDGGLWHQREAFRRDRRKHGRLVAEGKEHSFTRAARLEQRRDHGPRGLRKLTLRRHLRAEIGQSFHSSQQPPQIVFLHSHARMRAKNQSRKRVACGDYSGIRSLLVSLVLEKTALSCQPQQKTCHPDRSAAKQAKWRDLVFRFELSSSSCRLKMRPQLRKLLHHQQPSRRFRCVHFLMLQHPGVAPCGTNTAFNPAASAGLISDFGLLPIIQVASGSNSYLEMTER